MTDYSQHPITPPASLVEEWYATADNANEDVIEGVAVRAARWGADLELEACCKWVDTPINYEDCRPGEESDQLRATRRPKPPSLKEKTLEDFDALMSELDGAGNYSNCADRIRHAIQFIPENV